MSRSLLPLIPADLHVVQVLPAPDRITILTAPKPSSSARPLCGAVSSRVHSHYTRTLADLPWQGRAVAVQVRARRFRCAAAGCLRQVFAERLPGVVQSWARRTARIGDIQRHIGFALCGEPGSRLTDARGTALDAFSRGVKRDHDAVLAALVEPWCTGPVEGQINRLKLLKPTMYRRAKFDLLRRRILAAA